MISFLLALHPKRWRERYGAEYRALLEDSPITFTVLLDVLRNAARLQVAQRRMLLRVLAALTLSATSEVIAVGGGFTENIVWFPTTVLTAFLLGAVVLPWVVVISTVVRAARYETRTVTLGPGGHPARPTTTQTWIGVTLRRIGRGLAVLVAVYLVARAVIEPFVISPSEPESYRHDWGGPHLLGVLLVHCGPGLVIVVLAVRRLVRARRGG